LTRFKNSIVASKREKTVTQLLQEWIDYTLTRLIDSLSLRQSAYPSRHQQPYRYGVGLGAKMLKVDKKWKFAAVCL
jgi:hypothetical protein